MELEEKGSIVESLANTLRMTRAGRDITKMVYLKDTPAAGLERVDVLYAGGGGVCINVTADSGIAMVHDIVKALL